MGYYLGINGFVQHFFKCPSSKLPPPLDGMSDFGLIYFRGKFSYLGLTSNLPRPLWPCNTNDRQRAEMLDRSKSSGGPQCWCWCTYLPFSCHFEHIACVMKFFILKLCICIMIIILNLIFVPIHKKICSIINVLCEE